MPPQLSLLHAPLLESPGWSASHQSHRAAVHNRSRRSCSAAGRTRAARSPPPRAAALAQRRRRRISPLSLSLPCALAPPGSCQGELHRGAGRAVLVSRRTASTRVGSLPLALSPLHRPTQNPQLGAQCGAPRRADRAARPPPPWRAHLHLLSAPLCHSGLRRSAEGPGPGARGEGAGPSAFREGLWAELGGPGAWTAGSLPPSV